MQLQPLAKREPFRPPPRSPEDCAADDAEDALLADEWQELVTDISSDNGESPPESTSPTAEAAAATGDASSDATVSSASQVGDCPLPVVATPVVDADAGPSPSADGFGAGIVEAAPPDPPAGDSSPQTG